MSDNQKRIFNHDAMNHNEMVKKRGNNEGSIHKRKNGTWRVQVSIDGKRLSRTFKTHKECVTWMKKTHNRIDGGLTYETAHLSIEEFMNRWLVF